MSNLELQALKDRHWPIITDHMQEAFMGDNLMGQALGEAFSWHFNSGGKGLRALIPCLFAEIFSQPLPTLQRFGAACEMVHNATLIHDDIQDGDRMRRHVETVWAAFDKATALNLGDAMLCQAFLLLENLPQAPAMAKARRRLIRTTGAVFAGQQLERRLSCKENGKVWLKHKDLPKLEDYDQVVNAKTGGLFSATLVGAAELCGLPEAWCQRLEESAQTLGRLFQIQDDLLDILGEKGRQGPGQDLKEGKLNFLSIYALSTESLLSAQERLELLKQLSLAGSSTQGSQDAALALLKKSGAIEAAQNTITKLKDEAQQCLQQHHPDLDPSSLAPIAGPLCALLLHPKATQATTTE